MEILCLFVVDLKLQLWFNYYASHFFCYHCFLCLSRHKVQISAGITFKVRETERKRGRERGRKRGREGIKLKVKHDVFHLGRCSWGSDCRFLHESPDGGTRGI